MKSRLQGLIFRLLEPRPESYPIENSGDSFCRISQPFGIDFCCPGGWVRRRVKNQRFWAPGPGNQNIAQIAFSSIVNTHRFDGFTFWQFGVPNISDFGVSEKTIKSNEKR
jgi:hypothetical protein